MQLRKTIRRKFHRFHGLAPVIVSLALNLVWIIGFAVHEWFYPGLTHAEYRIVGIGAAIFVIVSIVIAWRVNRMAEPEPETDEEAQHRPITASEAARAAVRAMGLAIRVRLESGLRATPAPELLKQAAELRGMINRLLLNSGFFGEMDSRDKEALAAPVGTWDDATLSSYGIETVRAATLAWALGETKDIDTSVDDGVRQYLKLIADAPGFMKRARLREMSQLRAIRDVLLPWCARAELYRSELVDRAEAAPGRSWSELVEELANHAAKIGVINAPLEEDFPFGDRPYRELSEQQWSIHRETIMARYETMCWLTGATPELGQFSCEAALLHK